VYHKIGRSDKGDTVVGGIYDYIDGVTVNVGMFECCKGVLYSALSIKNVTEAQVSSCYSLCRSTYLSKTYNNPYFVTSNLFDDVLSVAFKCALK